MLIKKLSIILLCSLFIVSCGGKDKHLTSPETLNINDDKVLYNKGLENLKKGRTSKAVKYFQEIERVFPFSKLAVKGKVMTAYAYYDNRDYDDALGVINRFIQLHPGNKNISYVYYLKALSLYEQMSDTKRDQGITRDAELALRDVIKRYPDSKYAKDAKGKLRIARNHLAGKQLDVGRYYLEDRKYVAAINRFQKVIENYQDTNMVPEAYYRIVEGYMALGVQDEASRNAKILAKKFPSSEWTSAAKSVAGKSGGGLFRKFRQSSKKTEIKKDEKAKSWLPW